MRIQRNGIVQLSDLEQRSLWAYPFVLDMGINVRERLLTFHPFSCFWKCLLFRLWFIKVERFKSYKKRPWTSILDQCWPKCDKFVYISSVWGFELQSKFMHAHEIWVLRLLVINSSMFTEIGEWIKGLFAFLDFLKRKAVWLHLKNTEWFFFGWRLNLVCGLGCHFTRRREASLFAVPMQNEGEMYFDELYFLL